MFIDDDDKAYVTKALTFENGFLFKHMDLD